MSETLKIAVLRGDGVGPEVVEQALSVLEKVKKKYALKYTLREGIFGGAAIDAAGEPFPQETRDLAQASDAVFFGAIGGPKWDGVKAELRPESGLLSLRKTLGLYANLRPAKCWSQLMAQAPLKERVIAGVDILIVRELLGGAYFGKKGLSSDGQAAYDTIEYSEPEVRRIVKIALELAAGRKNKLTSVDKANVLETSRLWRKVAADEAKAFPQVSLSHLYVDNCAMQLCLNPAQFDVIVTENMFGDILSDQASVLGGSMGMLPSASLSDKAALYEPIHGSAPDIAGQNKANPLAAILSAAMMLRLTFKNESAAADIERAVGAVLDAGLRTADIWSEGCKLVGTKEMGAAVADTLSSF
ncbi:MAG: 3-isopropylmalate dehydrogenase [Clostridia bacterium]|jgi:3-isopropylmalate dehydrogenase|nr:3-isopropylmalate dehydrogenase [Clostridia bacterium]